MRVIDDGHKYALAHLDDDSESVIAFVKRQGPGYPGNVGSHPGPNMQEYLRALIHRTKYLDGQIPCSNNLVVIDGLRLSLIQLEIRAAMRHGRDVPNGLFLTGMEELPFCPTCGHIGCDGESCRRAEVARNA